MEKKEDSPGRDRNSKNFEARDEKKRLNTLRERSELKKLLEEKDRELEGYKKELTVMFTDIRKSKALLKKIGHNNWITLLQDYYDIVSHIIEDCEGTVVQRIGDGIMIRFPSQLLAVKATEKIHQEISSYNQNRKDKINVGIGIDSGICTVGEDDIWGDPVNVAKFLESKASPGQILISETVYEAVKNFSDIKCNYLGPYKMYEVDGNSESIEVYEVIWQAEEVWVPRRPEAEVASTVHPLTLNSKRIENGFQVRDRVRRSDPIPGRVGPGFPDPAKQKWKFLCYLVIILAAVCFLLAPWIFESLVYLNTIGELKNLILGVIAGLIGRWILSHPEISRRVAAIILYPFHFNYLADIFGNIRESFSGLFWR